MFRWPRAPILSLMVGMDFMVLSMTFSGSRLWGVKGSMVLDTWAETQVDHIQFCFGDTTSAFDVILKSLLQPPESSRTTSEQKTIRWQFRCLQMALQSPQELISSTCTRGVITRAIITRGLFCFSVNGHISSTVIWYSDSMSPLLVSRDGSLGDLSLAQCRHLVPSYARHPDLDQLGLPSVRRCCHAFGVRLHLSECSTTQCEHSSMYVSSGRMTLGQVPCDYDTQHDGSCLFKAASTTGDTPGIHYPKKTT